MPSEAPTRCANPFCSGCACPELPPDGSFERLYLETLGTAASFLPHREYAKAMGRGEDAERD